MAALTPFDAAQMMVDCAYDAVDHTGDLAINRKGVVIGEIAWDSCMCGQLVIAEQRRWPSREFPLEEVDHAAECGEPWLVVQYTMSMTRCVPSPDSNGNPPSVAALSAAADQASTDMSHIRRAVMCCLDAAYNTHDISAFELGPQTVVGPSGGCAGSDLIITIGYPNGCGC